MAKLAIQQTNITNLKTTLYNYYITGQSKAKDADVTIAIGTINTTVAQISTDQKSSYESNILADNKIRYERFVTAIDNADKTYTDAINEISKFNDIKNSDLRAELNSVIKANTSIYQYASKILNEKTTVGSEFTAVQKENGQAIFDIDEKYTTEAVEFQTEIVDALKTFTKAVSDKAHSIFDNTLQSAVNSKSTAYNNILGKYDVTVTNGAFADLTALISKAYLASESAEFAILLDGFIDQFSSTNIDMLIANGYKEAAAAEYKFLFDPISEQYKKDSITLAGYEYPNSTYTSDLKSSYTTNIINGAQKTATSAGNELYLKIDDVTAAIKIYTDRSTGILADAVDYNQKNVVNKDAYNRMLGYIQTAQTALDKAKTFVSSYYYAAADGLDNLISDAQSKIDGYTKDASGYNKATSAVLNENSIKNGCTGFINNTVPGIISGANITYEMFALTDAINILKKEYNTAAAKFGIDNETIKKFNSEINSYANDFSNISSNIGTSDPTVAQGKLLALEGKIAAERTLIVNFYDTSADNAVAEAIVSVSSSINTLKDAYKKDSTYLGNCDKTRVQDVYSLDDIGTAMSALEAKFNTYNTASTNTVLFYSVSLLRDVTKITGKLDEKVVAIKAVQDPIDANLAAYNRINAVLDGYKTLYTTLISKINGYASTTNKTYSYTETISNINKLIIKAQADVKTSYNNGSGSLNASSPVPDDAGISSGISDLDKTAANNEAIYQIGILTTSLISANSVYGNNKYTASDISSLTTRCDKINEAISNLTSYRKDAIDDGHISKDIDGNALTSQSIDFVATAIPAINIKIEQIKVDLTAYTDAVNNDSYILGDVKRDGSVLVNDYTELLKLAGDPSQVDVTSPTFYAADINLDKKINVGDVTAVANIIKNGSTTPSKAKAISRVAPVAAGTDALSLSAEGEGTTQRIAINLNNSTAYVAGQMDIKLPAGMTLLGESLSSRANGHSIYATDLSDGTHRVIISTVENNEFNNSESAILYLDVNITSSKASDKISVSNIMFTDASARIYNLADITSDETTGINSISSESFGSKIYSVGGKLMNALQKGVNIIRNADGSTKKIIKK